MTDLALSQRYSVPRSASLWGRAVACGGGGGGGGSDHLLLWHAPANSSDSPGFRREPQDYVSSVACLILLDQQKIPVIPWVHEIIRYSFQVDKKLLFNPRCGLADTTAIINAKVALNSSGRSPQSI